MRSQWAEFKEVSQQDFHQIVVQTWGADLCRSIPHEDRINGDTKELYKFDGEIRAYISHDMSGYNHSYFVLYDPRVKPSCENCQFSQYDYAKGALLCRATLANQVDYVVTHLDWCGQWQLSI